MNVNDDFSVCVSRYVKLHVTNTLKFRLLSDMLELLLSVWKKRVFRVIYKELCIVVILS